MTVDTICDLDLAILGGPKCVNVSEEEAEALMHWPIVTEEDEQAVLDVLRAGTMSGGDITRKFEQEMAAWLGIEHTLAVCNGTAALLASMWACGVGAGDEVICPSMTYWASACPAMQLGAALNFADIDPDTLCIDPGDIEHRIGPATRAIVVVHYAGHPADMDAIMAIAERHGIAVIEDVSHAQGTLYKGRKTGTIGSIGTMSLMGGKSFAIGEGGLICTADKALFDRCVAYGHYERTGPADLSDPPVSTPEEMGLAYFGGVPIGGVKHRLNQTCSAMGRVQLKHYDVRIADIQAAMNRFWDLLEGLPGIKAHRPPKDSGSTMGGWYSAHGLYRAEELDGLSCGRFCEAARAEGFPCAPGANFPLHLHRYFHDADIFHQGKPTAIAFGQRDVRQGKGTLPVSESIDKTSFYIPWMKHDRVEVIEQYAAAVRKVVQQADKLLA